MIIILSAPSINLPCRSKLSCVDSACTIHSHSMWLLMQVGWFLLSVNNPCTRCTELILKLLGECSTLWDKHEWVVFIGSMVSFIYTACLQCIYAQCTIGYLFYASAVWVEHQALSLSALLIFPAFARLFLLHIGLSLVLVCAVVYFACLVMVSELLWKYSEYTCSLQAAKQLLKLTIKTCACVPN